MLVQKMLYLTFFFFSCSFKLDGRYVYIDIYNIIREQAADDELL